MGNYFSGDLEFRFRFKDDEVTKDLINFIMYIRKIDALNISGIDCIDRYKEYVESHDDIICKGVKLYRDKYNQIRWEDVYLYAEAIDGAEFTKDSDFDPDDLIHVHSEYDEDELPTTPDEELNYQFMVKKLSDEYGIDEEHLAIYAFSSIHICEKYNADKGLTELIDLWSPYMYNDCIGNIRDEDQTFNKDYFRNNDGKIEHYEFCGDWCGSYYSTASCKSEFCKKLYDLGAESIKSKLSTSEWVEYEESGVRAGVKVNFKGYGCFHCGYQSETKEEICPKCLHVMVPGGEHMDQVEIPGGYNHD